MAISLYTDFNPRSPRGERHMTIDIWYPCKIFQSTLSARRATKISFVDRTTLLISIHALREESDPFLKLLFNKSQISIHALREESDQLWSITIDREEGISIHALREESDLNHRRTHKNEYEFQSTLSARRATS